MVPGGQDGGGSPSAALLVVLRRAWQPLGWYPGVPWGPPVALARARSVQDGVRVAFEAALRHHLAARAARLSRPESLQERLRACARALGPWWPSGGA